MNAFDKIVALFNSGFGAFDFLFMDIFQFRDFSLADFSDRFFQAFDLTLVSQGFNMIFLNRVGL